MRPLELHIIESHAQPEMRLKFEYIDPLKCLQTLSLNAHVTVPCDQFSTDPQTCCSRERWFHFIQPPLVCSRDRSINNSAWIRLNLLQLGEQTQLRCPVWLRGALLHFWWRWKEVGSEEQLFLIAIIVYINRNQGWYLSKVTTYRKNLKHYFSTLGEKKHLKVW